MNDYSRYFNKYRNIDERTLILIKELLKKGIFKLKFEKRFELLKYLNTCLSEIYNIERPALTIVFGKLNKEHKKLNKKEIIINDNLGIIYFLIRFRLIFQKVNNKKYSKSEAVNWSFSVLYNSEPDFFDRVFSKLIDEKIKKMNKKQKKIEIKEEIPHKKYFPTYIDKRRFNIEWI